MFERFTDRARSVVVVAQDEARALHHNWIGAEHILLGLVRGSDGIAGKVLADLGLGDLTGLRFAVESETQKDTSQPSGHIPFTPRAKKVLELSLREALQLGHNYIGTEHVLLGLARMLIDDLDNVTGRIVLNHGLTGSDIRQAVLAYLSLHKEDEPVSADPTSAVQSVPPAEKVLAAKKGVVVDKERLIKACEEYLSDLHTSLWGYSYDLFQKDSRRAAADFLAESVLGVVEHMEANKK